MLHDTAAASQAVRAHRAGALPFPHLNGDHNRSYGAEEQRGVVFLTESNIDEIILPAHWALGRMLRTHLS
jgi:hypothetical protein